LRKFAFFAAVPALCLFATLASAQQADAAFGFGTIMSSGSCDATSGLCPEKGGLYLNVNADVVFHRRIGFLFDTTWRASQGAYGGTGGQPFRPILSDFNALFQPKLSKKAGVDLSAGVGWQSTRFYLPYCTNSFTCNNFESSHHFLVDIGGGIRYYVWGHVFVRPEIRYYNIHNNTSDFSSNNVFRAGASIGYTIGPE
jgi:Outer membrane protein beta-barrel domain